jgi:hypothetical protein
MAKLFPLLIAVLLAGTSFAQDAQKDKEAQDRVRAEGAAGGTGQQLSKEQREAVKSGARQHRKHSEVLNRSKKGEQQSREHDEASSDRKKGRGAQ